MSFGSQLKMLRKEKNLMQKELAAMLNMSNGTISNYENGVHFPDEETLGKISDLFDVSVDFLLGRTKLRSRMEVLNQEIEDKYPISLLINKILSLDVQHQLELCQYIEYLEMVQAKKSKK